MIFIGGGSLLWRAVTFANRQQYSVDLVCVPQHEQIPSAAVELPIFVGDVNNNSDRLLAACSDGVGWSINNATILSEPLLGSGLRLYNIHNGPLPAYRGLPEVAIIFALLAGETRYGATLHEVTAAIDGGPVVDAEYFPIGNQDRFQEVMLAGVRACQSLFERNLAGVLSGDAVSHTDSAGESGYYGRRRLADLGGQVANPAFARATHLGVFAEVYPALAQAISVAGLTS